MSFEQIRLRTSAKDKLKLLADLEARSMANMLEVLIDSAFIKSSLKQRPKAKDFDKLVEKLKDA